MARKQKLLIVPLLMLLASARATVYYVDQNGGATYTDGSGVSHTTTGIDALGQLTNQGDFVIVTEDVTFGITGVIHCNAHWLPARVAGKPDASPYVVKNAVFGSDCDPSGGLGSLTWVNINPEIARSLAFIGTTIDPLTPGRGHELDVVFNDPRTGPDVAPLTPPAFSDFPDRVRYVDISGTGDGLTQASPKSFRQTLHDLFPVPFNESAWSARRDKEYVFVLVQETGWDGSGYIQEYNLDVESNFNSLPPLDVNAYLSCNDRVIGLDPTKRYKIKSPSFFGLTGTRGEPLTLNTCDALQQWRSYTPPNYEFMTTEATVNAWKNGDAVAGVFTTPFPHSGLVQAAVHPEVVIVDAYVFASGFVWTDYSRTDFQNSYFDHSKTWTDATAQLDGKTYFKLLSSAESWSDPRVSTEPELQLKLSPVNVDETGLTVTATLSLHFSTTIPAENLPFTATAALLAEDQQYKNDVSVAGACSKDASGNIVFSPVTAANVADGFLNCTLTGVGDGFAEHSESLQWEIFAATVAHAGDPFTWQAGAAGVIQTLSVNSNCAPPTGSTTPGANGVQALTWFTHDHADGNPATSTYTCQTGHYVAEEGAIVEGMHSSLSYTCNVTTLQYPSYTEYDSAADTSSPELTCQQPVRPTTQIGSSCSFSNDENTQITCSCNGNTWQPNACLADGTCFDSLTLQSDGVTWGNATHQLDPLVCDPVVSFSIDINTIFEPSNSPTRSLFISLSATIVSGFEDTFKIFFSGTGVSAADFASAVGYSASSCSIQSNGTASWFQLHKHNGGGMACEITAAEDFVVEGNEFVSLALEIPAGYQLQNGQLGAASFTITDALTCPTPGAFSNSDAQATSFDASGASISTLTCADGYQVKEAAQLSLQTAQSYACDGLTGQYRQDSLAGDQIALADISCAFVTTYHAQQADPGATVTGYNPAQPANFNRLVAALAARQSNGTTITLQSAVDHDDAAAASSTAKAAVPCDVALNANGHVLSDPYVATTYASRTECGFHTQNSGLAAWDYVDVDCVAPAVQNDDDAATAWVTDSAAPSTLVCATGYQVDATAEIQASYSCDTNTGLFPFAETAPLCNLVQTYYVTDAQTAGLGYKAADPINFESAVARAADPAHALALATPALLWTKTTINHNTAAGNAWQRTPIPCGVTLGANGFANAALKYPRIHTYYDNRTDCAFYNSLTTNAFAVATPAGQITYFPEDTCDTNFPEDPWGVWSTTNGTYASLTCHGDTAPAGGAAALTCNHQTGVWHPNPPADTSCASVRKHPHPNPNPAPI